MNGATLSRVLFWLGVAGLGWLLFSAIFMPLRIGS
jgi:hypothetical protein